MLFNYKYSGSSSVNSNSGGVAMSFAPDTLREPTFFVGSLNKHIPFREAISALHDIVVSDLRYQPKDKTEYKEWVAKQEEALLQEILAGSDDVKAKIEALNSEMRKLQATRHSIMSPFYKAQSKYFDYLRKRDYDAWWVLDPVITVHPDELFFECFSQDESSYGKLGCNYNVFKHINEFECGTTNIDYSATLYNEFQKIRNYKDTEFKVDPSGFEVQTTNEDSYKEVKIDLPESWVRGFLQVSSAMTLPATTLDIHPMDMHNFLFVLKRNKERKGPRSMKYILKPGHPIKVVFEPWGIEVVCARSIYKGNKPAEIRVWGRRRLLVLERLIPIAKKFTITLLGTGLPSFYVADLGDMNFTLGLSGWTANDWSKMGNFDLMAPRSEVDSLTQQKVYAALRENWVEDTNALANRLNLEEKTVLGALSAFTQAGRAIYDLDKQCYRIRELSREALPMDKLRFANEKEAEANKLIPEVKGLKASNIFGKTKLTGKIGKYEPEMVIDHDERMTEPKCTCNFYQQNKLFKGPCEHLLALRLAHNQKKTSIA